ncbi:MAG: DivIVA domain-containing protein [Bacilli bacterium]|jgi:DivIVA domain-containing protein|nr:DivIVA domain-containing protein [Bacilli bacterium]
MNDKIELSVKKILDKKFTPDVKGYNPEQVDAFLDQIIKDYLAFSEIEKEMTAHIDSLQASLAPLKESEEKAMADAKGLWEKNKQLEIDNASMRSRLQGIRPGDRPTAENMQYIQRIRVLEDFLNSEGYDPNNLKRKIRN